MKRILILIILIMVIKVNAQDKGDPIFKLNKETLIKELETYIQKTSCRNFKASAFDRIVFSKSNKGERSEIGEYWVNFQHIINYVPLGKVYIYSHGCSFFLLNKDDPKPKFRTNLCSTNILSSHDSLRIANKDYLLECYQASQKDKEAIAFILKALKINSPKESFIEKIQEREKYYEVYFNSGYCEIEKNTGIIFNEIAEYPIPPPEIEDEEQWEEINW